jgi:hypothetical protein
MRKCIILTHTWIYIMRRNNKQIPSENMFSVRGRWLKPHTITNTYARRHSLTLIQTHKRPERRKVREYVGWKLRQLVVIKMQVAGGRARVRPHTRHVLVVFLNASVCLSGCACLIPDPFVHIHELLCMRIRHTTSSRNRAISLTHFLSKCNT